MLPVTGPFSSTVKYPGQANYYGYRPTWTYVRKTWYRQKKPYNLPLGYAYSRKQVDFLDEPLWNTIDAEIQYAPGHNPDSYNKAYQKFREHAYQMASMGVNLAERRQAMDMMSRRILQLYQVAKAIRRGHLDTAWEFLGLPTSDPRVKGWRRKSRSFGSTWLEYHFGWEPLVKDVYTACEILSREFSNKPTAVASLSSDSWSVPADTNGVSKSYDRRTVTRMSALVRVSNPNLALASQMGVTNPAVLAWEVVPFSFVVDWFVNVGDFLQSFTDFAGFSIENPQRTQYTVVKERRKMRPPGAFGNADLTYVTCNRTLGPFPGPTLRVRPLKRLSPARGLTAISLLLQQLKIS